MSQHYPSDLKIRLVAARSFYCATEIVLSGHAAKMSSFHAGFNRLDVFKIYNSGCDGRAL